MNVYSKELVMTVRELVGNGGCAFLGCADNEAPVLLLRTADAHGRAHGCFQWPTRAGEGVRAPDWSPQAECGHGLHGALWGEGDGSLLSVDADALWYVVAAREVDVVDLDGKVKAPRAWVVYVGSREGATGLMLELAPGRAVVGSTLTGGDDSTLTGGCRSTLTGGCRSTLTGGCGSTLTGGDYSTLTGGCGSTLTGGDYSTLTGGDDSTLTGGDDSTLTGGDDSTLKGGLYPMFGSEEPT
jgi:hypothetical protein